MEGYDVTMGLHNLDLVHSSSPRLTTEVLQLIHERCSYICSLEMNPTMIELPPLNVAGGALGQQLRLSALPSCEAFHLVSNLSGLRLSSCKP